MKKFFSLTLTLAAMLSAMAVSAQAADYSFETDGTPEYYPSSSYGDVYGSRYNYGGRNVVDYQSPELEYVQLSTTQTGVMEKIMLHGLQGISASGGGIYGISPGGGTVEIPGFLQGGSTATPATPAFTELTQDFLLSNGAVGKISIPAIGVKNYYSKTGKGSSGLGLGYGTVAVDPDVIPYGTKLYITSTDGKFVYGYAVATDTGIAVQKGQILVDLFYETYAESVINGAIQVNVYVVG